MLISYAKMLANHSSVSLDCRHAPSYQRTEIGVENYNIYLKMTLLMKLSLETHLSKHYEIILKMHFT